MNNMKVNVLMLQGLIKKLNSNYGCFKHLLFNCKQPQLIRT